MKSGSKLTAVVLLFVALVLVNFLASRIPGRIDATADKIYTLSDGTRSLLGKIEEPIALEFYFSRGIREMPVSVKNYAERVEEMLRQYVRASRGKLTLTVINPQPDTPEEERAQVAGLNAQPLDTGERVIFGLTAIQADQQQTIPAFTITREQYLEYDLSQLIYSVQQVVKKKLGLITSLPLQRQDSMQARMTNTQQPGQLIVEEWSRTFEIVKVEPAATALPAGLDALAIVHPQGLHPKLQYSIDQFLLGGKPIFLAVDPSSLHFRQQTTPLQMLQGGTNNMNSDLPALLQGWGIAYDLYKVAGDPTLGNTFSIGGGPRTRSAFYLSLRPAQLNPQAMPTASLRLIQFFEPGSIALAPGSSLSLTPLIETSAQGGDVAATLFSDRSMNIEQISNSLPSSGKKTLAALVTGKFRSAFPGGEPPNPPLPDGSPAPVPPDAPAAAPTPALAESRASSNLIVVADADFLLDVMAIRSSGFGYTLPNDNLAFAVNAVEFLGGSQDLISVRGKRASLRPFDVVARMEVEANKVYGEKVRELDAKLTDVRTKLSQLEATSGESRQLIPPPDVQKAIDDYRKQQVAFSAERREIRRTLRTDIDALENRLLAINLLATPILVVLFGIWFHRRRQRA